MSGSEIQSTKMPQVYAFNIESDNLNLGFYESKTAFDNYSKILPYLSKIIDGTLPLNKTNREMLVKAIQTFKYTDYKIKNIDYHELRYETRQYKDYNKIANVILNIENEDFDKSIYTLEFLLSLLFPNIHNYINTFNLKNNINHVSLRIENNKLFINGSLIFIYNMLVKNSLYPIINNLRNSPYTFNEFMKNIKHKKCTHNENKTCVICLEDIKKNQVMSTTCCGHSYHYHCLYECFVRSKSKPVCPCCRKLQPRGLQGKKYDLNII